jgi:hypothetical protein
MANVADFEVCASAGDSPWRPVGAAWENEDGSVLLVTDWSPDVMFMLVPRRAATEPSRLEIYRRPDEVPHG